ncbi:hypothetical protein MCOR25_003336 [Pyricularia grisea]|nr:hypothetical protein MCOR25_003336 [Pyricularia grisea]
MDGGVKRRLRNSTGSGRDIPSKGAKDSIQFGDPLSASTPPRPSRGVSNKSFNPSPSTRSRWQAVRSSPSAQSEPAQPPPTSTSVPLGLISVRSISVASTEDASEIIVKTGAAETTSSEESMVSTPLGTDSPPLMEDPLPTLKPSMSAMVEEDAGPSCSRCMSELSDQSELSSVPSSLSSKATTPIDLDRPEPPVPPVPPAPEASEASETSKPLAPSPEPVWEEPQPSPETVRPLESVQPPPPQPAPRPAKFRIKYGQNKKYDLRPRTSIPTDVSTQEYAIQCIAAAESSRLNPYALHPDEYLMLRDHISQAQITTYLNLRNGILRLWVRNPTFVLTREEAIGCAKDSRWFDVASVCFDWLVREGYINFGCCEVRPLRSRPGAAGAPSKQKTIVVIGAGLSGLGCARQLQGLFAQYARRFRERGELLPKVVVLEGRSRIGGRVYSRPFRTAPPVQGDGPRRRYTAEMGGMIITGFDRGNPINILIRGQLGLGCHALRSDLNLVNIYDTNGKPFDSDRDMLIDKLYNHCIERVAEYKWKLPLPKLLEGKRDLIDEGKDSWAEVHKTISYVEETAAAQPQAPSVAEQNIAPRVDLVPVSSDRATGRVHLEPGTPAAHKAAHTVKLLGWNLKQGVDDDADIDIGPAVNAPDATFGSVLDETIMQFKDIVDLNSQDMRMFNWHVANLEYSNATNVHQLSLRGWDIDMGNEWEGKHTMVVGGYQSLALGLAEIPSPLDIQYKKVVKTIRKTSSDEGSIPAEEQHGYKIELEDGTNIDADYVVNTIPLGVLKHGDITFDPPLPSWKSDAIDRLGFGVLNKVVLVYDQPFWEEDKDIFGVLRAPQSRSSLHPKDYSSGRGRFFQWFNVTNTSGMPTLLALMAGDAAFDTEKTPNDDLVAEATEVLRSIFGQSVPQPRESIITRWASDRFARGSYSSAGPGMQLEDYDLMSRPIDRLYFAGEHTSATHPATVHGAYMSGLRAAAEVLNDMLGPIEVQTPLIVPKETGTTSSLLKRKSTADQVRDPQKEAEDAWQLQLWEHQWSVLGDHPLEPAKVATKAHLLFSKANIEAARQRCLEGRRPGKGPPTAHEVRAMAGKMWNAASEEERRPFIDQVATLKEAYVKAMAEYSEKSAEWNKRALEIAVEFEKKNPKPTADANAIVGPSSLEEDVKASIPAAAPPAVEEAGHQAKKPAVEKVNMKEDGDVDMTG